MTIKQKQSYDEILAELNNLKKFEHQLVESEKKYRSLTENINVGVYRNTPGAKGKFIEVNPAFLTIFGYKNKSSILDLNVSDLYTNPNERKKVSDKIKDQGFLKDEVVQLKKKDGTTITCAVSASAVKDNTGTIKYYDGIIDDISERVKIETGLKASEERYHKLFDSSKDAIMTLSPPTWKFTSGNSAIAKMFNVRSVEEFLTYGPWDISPDKQPDGKSSASQAKKMIEKAMADGSNYFEWTHKRINGNSFPATVLLTRVELKNETFLQATVRDITSRKKGEELHEKLLDTARHLTKSLDLKVVFDQICKHARALLNAHGATIYMLDDDGVTINPAYSNDPPYDKLIMSTKININNSLTGKVIKAKKEMIFNNSSQAKGSFHVPGTPEVDDEHIIISPFIIENKVIGTLNIYRRTPSFSKDDLVTVNTFAAYASTAIKNARVYEKLAIEIKERQIAEGEIRLSEEKYRTLAENLSVGIYRVTAGNKGKFIEVNQAFLNIFGFKDKNSLFNVEVSTFYQNPSDRKKVSRILLKQGFIKNEELNFVKKDGTPIICADTAIAVKDNKGNIIHYDGIIEDITERVMLKK